MLDDSLLVNEPRLKNLIRYFADEGPARRERIPHPDSKVDEITRHASGSFRQAAVLVPIVKPSREAFSQIILTVRSPNLSSHAGQVSLPGGTRELEDADDIMTALREAEEEIGLDQQAVQIMGQLGKILLPSGFEVTPVIGLVDPEPPLRACPVEVHEIFTAPTNLLMDPASYQESSMEYQGQPRKILELFYRDFRVWGATAVILHHLAREIDSLED